MRRRRVPFSTGALFAAGLLVAAAATQTAGAEAAGGVMPAGAVALPEGLIELDGRPAPALRLANLEGMVTDLGSLRGRWVMVHFWASWCVPCRRELPALARAFEALGGTEGTGLRLVMVNTAETEDDVFAFLGAVAPSLDTLLDLDGAVTERWQPRGLPSSFLVDPAGRLRYLALGGRPWDNPAYLAFLRSLATGAR